MTDLYLPTATPNERLQCVRGLAEAALSGVDLSKLSAYDLGDLALLAGASHRVYPSAGFGQAARAALEEVCTRLAVAASIPAWWAGGAFGLGFQLQLLDPELVPMDMSPLLDELLVRALQDPALGSDHCTGRAGLLQYVLRLPDPPMDVAGALLTGLGRAARPESRGVAWVSEDGRRYLGMAHGSAGAIAALSLAVLRGLDAAPLLSRAAAWAVGVLEPVVAQRAAPAFDDGRLDPVPALIDGSDGQPRLSPISGWCSGGAAVALSLLAAARTLGDPGLEGFARRLGELSLRAHAARLKRPRDNVTLCCGAAGRARVFARLHAATGEAAYAEAARASLDRCLAALLAPSGHPPTHDVVPSLWTGAAGPLLTLLSGLGEVSPAWDGLLGLDVCALVGEA